MLDVVGQGGGSPLSGGLKDEMEGRLGADFSDVKVHTDGKASDSAKAVQANAYTVGSDVVVRSDRWSPSSDEGKKTIAHELTHVMQQREGPVDGTSAGNGISVSHPSDKFEQAAERNAETAMASPAPAASAQLEVQREEEPQEDELQGQFVQREEEPQEDEECRASSSSARKSRRKTSVQGQFVQREEEPQEDEECRASSSSARKSRTAKRKRCRANSSSARCSATPTTPRTRRRRRLSQAGETPVLSVRTA